MLNIRAGVLCHGSNQEYRRTPSKRAHNVELIVMPTMSSTYPHSNFSSSVSEQTSRTTES